MTGSRTNEKALGKEVNQMQELIGKLKKVGSKEICKVKELIWLERKLQ